MPSNDVLEAIRAEFGRCREWIDDDYRRCGKPVDYLLWGKLLPGDALGPRCHDCAAKHVPENALGRNTIWALVHVARLADRLAPAVPGEAEERSELPELPDAASLAVGEIARAAARAAFTASLTTIDGEHDLYADVFMAIRRQITTGRHAIRTLDHATRPAAWSLPAPASPTGEAGDGPADPDGPDQVQARVWDGTIDGLRGLVEWAGNGPDGEPQFSWLTDATGWSDPMLGARGIKEGDVFVRLPDGWVVLADFDSRTAIEAAAPGEAREGERVKLYRHSKWPAGICDRRFQGEVG